MPALWVCYSGGDEILPSLASMPPYLADKKILTSYQAYTLPSSRC